MDATHEGGMRNRSTHSKTIPHWKRLLHKKLVRSGSRPSLTSATPEASTSSAQASTSKRKIERVPTGRRGIPKPGQSIRTTEDDEDLSVFDETIVDASTLVRVTSMEELDALRNPKPTEEPEVVLLARTPSIEWLGDIPLPPNQPSGTVVPTNDKDVPGPSTSKQSSQRSFDLNQAIEKICSLRKQLNATVDANAALRTTNAQKDETIAGLRSQLEQLQTSSKTLRGSKTEKLEEVIALREQLHTALAENAALKSREGQSESNLIELHRLRTENAEHTAEIERLNETLTKKDEEIVKLDGNMLPLESRLTGVLAANAKLRKEKEAAASSEKALQDKLSQLREQLRQTEEKLASAEDERDQMRQELSDSATHNAAEVKRLQAEVRQTRSDIEKEKKATADEVVASEALLKRLATLEAEIRKLRDAEANHRTTINSLQNQIQRQSMIIHHRVRLLRNRACVECDPSMAGDGASASDTATTVAMEDLKSRDDIASPELGAVPLNVRCKSACSVGSIDESPLAKIARMLPPGLSTPSGSAHVENGQLTPAQTPTTASPPALMVAKHASVKPTTVSSIATGSRPTSATSVIVSNAPCQSPLFGSPASRLKLPTQPAKEQPTQPTKEQPSERFIRPPSTPSLPSVRPQSSSMGTIVGQCSGIIQMIIEAHEKHGFAFEAIEETLKREHPDKIPVISTIVATVKNDFQKKKKLTSPSPASPRKGASQLFSHIGRQGPL
ncbi:hypothetical protein AAVH_22967 [Aphelenchoides avenae]|nr:hypothetical protein AAVH_22967 [Aphelenchus avenae]